MVEETLKALPSSKLHIMSYGFNSPVSRNSCMGIFAENGIAADRIHLLESLNHNEYLAYYGNIDIVLETFPFTGNTTTMDALWMGVPVPTIVCDSYAGRLGLSILSNAGLNDLIAYTEEEYVEKVTSLAENMERLSCLRKNLRSMLQSSPVCNRPMFSKDLEGIYHTMWRDWCAKQT